MATNPFNVQKQSYKERKCPLKFSDVRERITLNSGICGVDFVSIGSEGASNICHKNFRWDFSTHNIVPSAPELKERGVQNLDLLRKGASLEFGHLCKHLLLNLICTLNPVLRYSQNKQPSSTFRNTEYLENRTKNYICNLLHQSFKIRHWAQTQTNVNPFDSRSNEFLLNPLSWMMWREKQTLEALLFA